jgi:hypothetical protein
MEPFLSLSFQGGILIKSATEKASSGLQKIGFKMKMKNSQNYSLD